MHEPMLLFETDPQLGTPKLKAINGAAKTWTPKELSLLEEMLRPRYDGLVRDGEGTLEFRNITLLIKKKDGDNSRQPTLELHSTDCRTTSPEKPIAFKRPQIPTTEWGKGFLAEIDRLFASDQFNAVLPPEKAMLDLVRKELGGLLDKTSTADFTLLVLLSILLTAEQVSRTQTPNEPRPYAYALSGIERLLSAMSANPQTPWGQLPANANTEPAPSWLGRFWAKVTGA